jgi:hypothetical protein
MSVLWRGEGVHIRAAWPRRATRSSGSGRIPIFRHVAYTLPSSAAKDNCQRHVNDGTLRLAPTDLRG